MTTAGAVPRPPRSPALRLLLLLVSASLAGPGCATHRSPALPEWTASETIDGVAIRLTARDADEARARDALSAGLAEARRVGALVLVEHEGSEIGRASCRERV